MPPPPAAAAKQCGRGSIAGADAEQWCARYSLSGYTARPTRAPRRAAPHLGSPKRRRWPLRPAAGKPVRRLDETEQRPSGAANQGAKRGKEGLLCAESLGSPAQRLRRALHFKHVSKRASERWTTACAARLLRADLDGVGRIGRIGNAGAGPWDRKGRKDQKGGLARGFGRVGRVGSESCQSVPQLGWDTSDPRSGSDRSEGPRGFGSEFKAPLGNLWPAQV